jgi:serine/threonine protein kinase
MAEQLLVVAQFIAACKKPPVYCIITEYMSQGTLRMYLNKKDPYSLSAETILKLALDISRGMEYLHAQGVIHRDLKSQNLLLNDEMRVKVADFGTSCLETKCQATKGNKGTYRWMAPEMTKEKPYTRKVDVYSFGIVLWELTTCLLPFQGMTPVQAAYAASEKVLILFQCPCLERIPLFLTDSLFAWLISHQPAVLFSQNKPATNNQPTVLFSQNKPATSQPNRL